MITDRESKGGSISVVRRFVPFLGSHRAIMEHFDPTVVTLRKKRKIILADSKLKDLL